MHPNAFLQVFWRSERRPEVFVAMSFNDSVYGDRYRNVIVPAIESIEYQGLKLKPRRVDFSKSGDSILTEINDGIAHSLLVLADVSKIGDDSKTGDPYRNGNVMYEVGIALACRQPHEVLLVRDDKAKLLFDVTTIPCETIVFAGNEVEAKKKLVALLQDRIKEDSLLNDARTAITVRSMTGNDVNLLLTFSDKPRGRFIYLLKGVVNIPTTNALARLLDKQLIEMPAFNPAKTDASYRVTDFGHAVAAILRTMPCVAVDPPVNETVSIIDVS